MKDKKILFIVSGVVLLAIVALLVNRSKTDSLTNNPSTVITDTTSNQEINNEDKTIFGSIKDAMSKSLSLKCEYPSARGKVVAYVKGNSIRMDNLSGDNNSGNAIIKDNRLWTWNDKTGEGVVMTLPKPEEGNQSNSDQIINDLEEQKQFCSPAVVSDSAFDPPANINFQDLSKMTEQLTGFIPAE